jgi:hypothetical protein
MAERLTLSDDFKSHYKRLCTVPVIQNARFETLPTLSAPAVKKNTVNTITFGPDKDGLPSLYPFDAVGIYDRDRFIKLGGFDGTLTSFHWQLMDFGFRSHLWGEEIKLSQNIKVTYEGVVPPENYTADSSSLRFYLKNLAPIFRGDYANIPLRRFPAYFRASGKDIFSAWDEFSEGRRWVKVNRFRFKSDARTIAELWNDIEINAVTAAAEDAANDTDVSDGRPGEHTES